MERAYWGLMVIRGEISRDEKEYGCGEGRTTCGMVTNDASEASVYDIA